MVSTVSICFLTISETLTSGLPQKQQRSASTDASKILLAILLRPSIKPPRSRLVPNLRFAPRRASVINRVNRVRHRLVFAEVFAVKLIFDQHYPCSSVISADPEARHEGAFSIKRASVAQLITFLFGILCTATPLTIDLAVFPAAESGRLR